MDSFTLTLLTADNRLKEYQDAVVNDPKNARRKLNAYHKALENFHTECRISRARKEFGE